MRLCSLQEVLDAGGGGSSSGGDDSGGSAASRLAGDDPTPSSYALRDEQAAIDKYLTLCDMGGTKPFRQMVVDAGLGDPFDEAVIERTMRDLRPHLQLDS